MTPPRRTARRTARRAGAVAVAAGLLLAGLGPAQSGAVAAAGQRAADPAEKKRQLDRELAELRDALEGTSDALVKAAEELARSKSDLAEAQTALAGAQGALAAAQRRDEELEGKLELAVAAQQKASRELEARQDLEVETRSQLGRIAREAYLNAGVGNLSVALDAESPEQFADRLSVVGSALRTQNGAIERLEVQQADTRARRTKLTAARKLVADLKKESERVVVARREASAAAAAAQQQVAGVVARQNVAVGVISAKKAEEQRRVQQMEAESSQLAAILAARAAAAARRASGGSGSGGSGGSGSGGGASDGGSGLSRPVSSPVTSQFGRRYHPVLHYWRLHAGTDFGAPCGTPVRASASGEIVRAGWAGGYGNQLVIDHGRMRGQSVATSYNHLTRFVVRSGNVKRGQLVAYSGTTGLSTGCHLHFEVRLSGTPVNPMNWL